MASSTLKPDLLVAFQSYLRAHPVRRAAFWSIGCFVLLTVLHLLRGEAVTPSRAVGEAAAWALAGVLFYLVMRWWEAKHAR